MGKIAIVDFGSRYMELIDLRLEEFGVETEILQPEETEEIKDPEIKGLILSGGPKSVIDITSPKPHPNLFEVDKPVLGICYGHQVIATQLGGEVERFDEKEYGEKEVKVETDDQLFKEVSQRTKVWMSHNDFVIRMPDEFKTLIGREGVITAYKHKKKDLWGIQFHPEVHRNQEGRKILKNFLDICNCPPQFSAPGFTQETVASLKERLKGKKTLAILTGSAEDYVTAELAARAIPKQEKLIILFVDHGLQREEERDWAEKLFADQSQFKVRQLEDDLFDRLQGVSQLEHKREMLKESWEKLIRDEVETENIDCLISSKTKAEEGQRLEFMLDYDSKRPGSFDLELDKISPILNLTYDELRGLGVHLGLPDLITHRSPLLDSKLGLAAQVAGQVTREKIEALRKVDKIIIDKLEASGLLDKFLHVPWILEDPFPNGNEEERYLLTLSFIKNQPSRNDSFSRPQWQLLEEIVEAISAQIPTITSIHYDVTSQNQVRPGPQAKLK